MNTNGNSTNSGPRLESIGAGIIRYGLALVLIWVGILKFTSYEAMGIAPLVKNSPLLSWVLNITSIESFSKMLGSVEIILGVLILCRRISARLSAIGSIGAIITFFITLTFLLSTPGVWQPDYGFPFLSPMPGQFLAKDVLLFGAAVWTAGEALAAANFSTNTIGNRPFASTI